MASHSATATTLTGLHAVTAPSSALFCGRERSPNANRAAMTGALSATLPRVGEPVLDRHVNVAQLWRLACDAARKGEKWGQRKKSVSDAMENYYTQLRREKRGAKRWVAAVVDVLGFFDPSADLRAVEVGLQVRPPTRQTVTPPVWVLNCSGWRSCRPRRRRTLCTRACSADRPARTAGGSTPSVKVVGHTSDGSSS